MKLLSQLSLLLAGKDALISQLILNMCCHCSLVLLLLLIKVLSELIQIFSIGSKHEHIESLKLVLKLFFETS